MRKHEIVELGNMEAFQSMLLINAQQEQQTKKPGVWSSLLATYIRQREIISYNPYPESNEFEPDDEVPPSIKLLTRNIDPRFENELYRWGLQNFSVANYRIIFAVYDYYKVLLLHVFDKQYNNDVKREDIKPAELVYDEYLGQFPSKYR
ncbi:hypothetical protein BBI15_07330 [Planococcus plakortidis]|uniref:Type II toxin-antitoxin system RelE/ParE family toxin n=1 Tax=Planococcus plakortidis TaxID=1038856 RepID=A0A1C7E8L6_9BACL|nr:hypothetical protein [Planococcus plakortidis]ANU20035.1 hypothetical protein BBI15_07330 [Planococcus plakortidis]